MVDKKNIFLVGPMGAGKSTIGRYLARRLSMDFYDSDQEIERRTGADISWVFDIEGEDGFREREEKIIEEITAKQGIVLATGGGAIKSKETRNRLYSRGVVVYLKITVDQQLIRTMVNKKRPLLQRNDPRNVLEILSKERDILYEEVADVIVHTDDKSVKTITNQIIQLIEYHEFF